VESQFEEAVKAPSLLGGRLLLKPFSNGKDQFCDVPGFRLPGRGSQFMFAHRGALLRRRR